MAADAKRNSRRAILDRLRSRVVDAVELPNLSGPDSIGDAGITYSDLVGQFQNAVELVGGKVERVADLSQAEQRLRDDALLSGRVGVQSGLPFNGNVDLEAVTDPHELSNLDLLIAQAEFGVAENGAMWLTDANIKHRVALFITQHLAVIVSRHALVDNMHQAYDRIGQPTTRFGVFIAGPSKTADIEQSLVIGAHGCRSLTVIVTD